MSDERHQRWQKITIAYFGTVIQTFVTLDVAALGFWFSLLRDGSFLPPAGARYWMVIAGVALGCSAGLGLWTMLNRLRDFQGTARRARGRDDAPSKEDLDTIGDWTWASFYGQVTMFLIGLFTLAGAILQTSGAKLTPD